METVQLLDRIKAIEPYKKDNNAMNTVNTH